MMAGKKDAAARPNAKATVAATNPGGLEILNREIDKLPNKTKEVFYLSKKRGFSNIEISELLDISVKTVEGHMTKAFKLLRTQVKKFKT